MSEIFREVDEDVRKDQARTLWRAYGRYAVGLAVAVVLATAAFQFWQWYSTGQREAETDGFVDAMILAQSGRPGAAAERFAAVAENGGGGIASMALLQRASALIAAGDPAAAVALYGGMVADSGVAEVLRDLARLLAAQVVVQTESRAAVDERLAPLLLPNNPWRYTAAELSGLAALRAGDFGAARAIFTVLADDPTAPQGNRSRAAELLAALGDEG